VYQTKSPCRNRNSSADTLSLRKVTFTLWALASHWGAALVMPAAMSPSTPPMGKASAAAGARLMEDVERALARVDPLSSSHLSASPSARRVVTALHGDKGLARLDLERRLVSRAACDALAELQRRLDAAQEETRDAIAERDRARAERDVCERERRNERTEWLANRDAVRREISLARDRVAAVKEEHKRNLVELDRERRRVRVACEETEAVRDELARATDSNELLRRRLARARGEIAKKSAEAAARADAADAAFAANARNAAIAAREALRRDDDEDVHTLLGDGGVEKKKENRITGTTSDEAGGALSSPSRTPDGKVFHPEKFGDGISRDVFSVRDLERHGSRADWARAYGRVVAELDAARARAAKAESALAAATAALQKRAVSDAETSETTDGLTNASLVTRAEAAEARSLRLARLNAGLLDRLGEAVGAAPRYGEDMQRVSFFSNSADEEENAVQEVGRDVFVATTKKKSALAENPSEANVLREEVKGEQTHDAHDEDEAFFEGSSSVTRKRDVLRALESEVKLLDAEYRETIDAIKRVHDGIAGGDLDRRRSRSIEVDALAARANSLEDAIVRKVEEVQRLRDDVFGVSRKIEL